MSTQTLPTQPQDEQGLVFAAPWQAKTFAMAVTLCEQGVFTWPQWAAAFSAHIAASEARGEPVDQDSYYHLWQEALEQLVRERKIGLIEK